MCSDCWRIFIAMWEDEYLIQIPFFVCLLSLQSPPLSVHLPSKPAVCTLAFRKIHAHALCLSSKMDAEQRDYIAVMFPETHYTSCTNHDTSSAVPTEMWCHLAATLMWRLMRRLMLSFSLSSWKRPWICSVQPELQLNSFADPKS